MVPTDDASQRSWDDLHLVHGTSRSRQIDARHSPGDVASRAWLRPQVLDGDALRATISADLGFTRADRDEQVGRVASLALGLATSGHVPIVALVSPYRAGRDAVRRMFERFIEVYVTCPLPVLIERDPKQLYARALRGEIQGLTGLSDPYEPPLSPEVVADTSVDAAPRIVERVVKLLEREGARGL